MYIERLHLRGFKSFGTSQDLLFSPGFTAIVGPNGSGKSNILDALRWVLGDGGFQRLRISRQGDLLFSGSASVLPASRAEVSLEIRDGVGAAEKSCILKRTYAPETGAVLTVDGTRTRMTELYDVKRQWRLEGDQFAFIGQGEVAEAIRQRPSQRRAQLEVLFGIDQYRKKRNESMAKLASAEEESLRLGALAAELNARREEIAPAVLHARKARGITDELEDRRRLFYFHRRRLIGESIINLEMDIARLKGEEALRSRWSGLWERMYARSQGERAQVEDMLRSLRKNRDELFQRRENLRRNCFASAASVREIRTRIRSIEGEEQGLAERLGEIAAEHGDVSERERTISSELHALRQQRDALRKRMDLLRSALEAEESERKRAAEKKAELSAELEALDARIMSKQAFLADCGSRLGTSAYTAASLEKDIAEAEAGISGLEAEELSLVEQHADAFAACRRTAASLQQVRKESASLETSIEDLRSAESSSYPEPVRFLVSASRLGKISIPVAVAAESFRCPPGITGALEAYLGGRQFWIFVTTLAEAGACIDLLKERRAGRATFLPLERSRPRFPDRRVLLPERGVVGWAMELITPDPEWEMCVSHMLGDLLLVEEYKTGAALAGKGLLHPVASLDGEVFLPSGTVSGGRTKAAAGAIERRRRISSEEERLEDLKKEIRRLSALLEKQESTERARAAEKETAALQLQEARRRAEEKRRDLSLEKMALERLERDVARGSGEIELWEVEKHRLEEELKPFSAEKTSAGKEDEASSVPARLSEVENTCTLLEERLSSVRALRERSEGELERSRGRMKTLSRDKEATIAREVEEKQRLSVWGKDLYGIFISLQQTEEELEGLSGKGIRLSSRSQMISGRSRTAAEKAAVAREKLLSASSKKEGLGQELAQLMEIWEEQYPYNEAEIPTRDEGEEASSAVRRLERELKALGSVDWGALSEDESLSSRTAFLSDQLSDVKNAMTELKGIIAETDRHVGIMFTEALASINTRFSALFSRLFGGGEVKLRMQIRENEENGDFPEDEDGGAEPVAGASPEWDSGVEIVARPPGKHLQNIAQLSGGEQTLTAIAYLFASMEVAEVPIAVLDEVDAALDESNLLRFGELAREYAAPKGEGAGKGIQLLVMTHRRATMERADILYGVTLAEPGLSRVIGMKLEDWAEPPVRRRTAGAGGAAR